MTEQNVEKFNRIENEHDKVFKDLFCNVNDAVHIINKVLKLNMKSNEIQRYTNSFVTSGYKYKEADCVYKKKNERVFFVIEHQSVVDFRMPYRMSNYQIEVMRSCESYKNTKDNKEALVIGIVLYTGRKEWNAKLYIRNIQYKLEDGARVVLGDNKTLGNYSVLDVNKCTEGELLKDEGLISKVMLIEKVRKTEKLGEILIRMIKYLDENGLKYIENLIKNIMVNDLSKATREEILKLYRKTIEGKGSEEEMELAITRTIRNEIEGIRRKGRREGKKEGIREGKISVAKNLLTMGYSIDQVGKMAELNESELKELKEKTRNKNT